MRSLIGVLGAVALVVVGAVAVTVFNGSVSTAQQSTPGANTAQPQPEPQVVKREVYGDWVYVCVGVPNSTWTRCSISQQLSTAKSNTTVFLWRITRNDKGELVSSWQTPTDILVNRGILLDAGTEKPIAIPYRICTSRGCEAAANLAPDLVAALAKAEKASVTIYLIDGRKVSFTLSVNGLSQALAALQS